MASRYKVAQVKFNNGRGALLCDGCSVIIAYGFEHEDKKHYCFRCRSECCEGGPMTAGCYHDHCTGPKGREL